MHDDYGAINETHYEQLSIWREPNRRGLLLFKIFRIYHFVNRDIKDHKLAIIAGGGDYFLDWVTCEKYFFVFLFFLEDLASVSLDV